MTEQNRWQTGCLPTPPILSRACMAGAFFH